jgi:hypothetical protein
MKVESRILSQRKLFSAEEGLSDGRVENTA